MSKCNYRFNIDFSKCINNVDSHGDIILEGAFDKSKTVHYGMDFGFANDKSAIYEFHFKDGKVEYVNEVNTMTAQNKNLYGIFDVSDAVIVDELQPDTPEYWHYQYERLFKIQDIIRNEVAQHGFDNQYVRDMQTNVHQLIYKLKNYEKSKSK